MAIRSVTRARPTRVTSADVARAAGFSRQLVGFVLNNTPGQSIPQATREKVLRAAEQLGYVPHGPAQALRRGQGRTVLLTMPDVVVTPAMSQLTAALADELADHGLTLVTYLLGAERRSPRDVAAALAPVAVVGLTPFSDAEAATFRASGALVVLPRARTKAASSLDDSGRLMGGLQLEYLADRGHRRIGYALPDDPRADVLSFTRYEGARAAAERRGLPAVTRTVVGDDAAPAIEAWRAAAVTAVACFNDDTAFAVLAAARRAGLRVPADLAVMGADDIPAARHAAPPLTTISIEGRHAGIGLAQLLLDLLRDPDAGIPDIRENVRVIVRESA